MRSAHRRQSGTTGIPYPDDSAPYVDGARVRTSSDATQALRTAPAPPAAGSTTGDRESTGELVSDVVSDISTLFRQEVALAKAEMREEVKKAGKGARMFAAAGGAGYFVLLFALLAVMFGLGEVMALGWAALIITVVLGAVAAVLALRGRSTVRAVHPTPAQTVETLREDVQWAQGRRG